MGRIRLPQFRPMTDGTNQCTPGQSMYIVQQNEAMLLNNGMDKAALWR
jgi:hypothetical protein